MTSKIGFTSRQSVALVAIGIVFWFLGAILLRAIESFGSYRDGMRALVYALIVPGTLPFILLVRALVGLGRHQIAIAAALVTAVAILCDGIALVVIPQLYGHDIAGAGAAILWAGGVAILLGMFLNRPV